MAHIVLSAELTGTLAQIIPVLMLFVAVEKSLPSRDRVSARRVVGALYRWAMLAGLLALLFCIVSMFIGGMPAGFLIIVAPAGAYLLFITYIAAVDRIDA